MGGLTSYHYQTIRRYKETTTYDQNNSNIILQVIQVAHTPKIIFTETNQITIIPRYQAENYEYLSQLHKTGFIRSGREHGTGWHVDLYKKWIQNDSGGVFGAALKNQD